MRYTVRGGLARHFAVVPSGRLDNARDPLTNYRIHVRCCRESAEHYAARCAGISGHVACSIRFEHLPNQVDKPFVFDAFT